MDRGIGPPAQACTFWPEEVDEGRARAESEGPGRPQLAGHAMVIAVWWMLREAELIYLDLKSAVTPQDKGTGELRLGATKMDYKGRGARRGLRCTCAGPAQH